MPQLKIETFVTQYFWLIVILFSFYFIMYTYIIPKMSSLNLTRKKLETVELKTENIESNKFDYELKIVNFNKSLNSNKNIKNTIQEWAKKNV